MSAIPKPATPTYVACPTTIDVYDWLMMHHISQESCGKSYDIFTVAEYPHFVNKHGYIRTNVAIPLGPLTLELAAEINLRAGFPPRDQVTICVKYPLLASIKAGTFKGDLQSNLQANCGIAMAIGVPKIYGTISMQLKDFLDDPMAELWVEFDLCVFDVEYKGKFPVLSFPRAYIWGNQLIAVSKDATALTTAVTSGVAELEASSTSVRNETNSIAPPGAVAVAAVTPTQ